MITHNITVIDVGLKMFVFRFVEFYGANK